MVDSSTTPQLILHTPRPTRGVIALIAITAAGWLLPVLIAPLRELIVERLLIDGATLGQGELWSALTHGLFSLDFLGALLGAAMIYFFGSEVARRCGDRRLLLTALAATIAGGAVAIPAAWAFGLEAPLSGPMAAVGALIAMYCWQLWRRPLHFFFIELTGKSMLALFLAFDFLIALLAVDPTSFIVRLVGALVGLLVASDSFRPAQLKRRYHYWRVRRNLKLVARTPEQPDDAAARRRRRPDGTWIN